MVLKSGVALRIWPPIAPFRSPVATPIVVGLPSIWPKPPTLVRIAPPILEQVGVFANPSVGRNVHDSTPPATTANRRVTRFIPPSLCGAAWLSPVPRARDVRG